MSAPTRHFARHYVEMLAAMFLPTFGVIAVVGAGLVEDIGALLVVQEATA